VKIKNFFNLISNKLYLEINTSNNTATVVEQAEETESAAKKIAETSYCFRFTWLGPQYTPDSEYKNATCVDKLRGAKGRFFLSHQNARLI
jgi:hypothetical protein